jgi:hypothetical protein
VPTPRWQLNANGIKGTQKATHFQSESLGDQPLAFATVVLGAFGDAQVRSFCWQLKLSLTYKKTQLDVCPAKNCQLQWGSAYAPL